LNADLSILWFVNQTLASSWLDAIMNVATHARYWIPIYLLGAGLLVWKQKRRGVYILLAIALLILVSDQLASHVIKGLWERLRPCATLADGSTVVPWIRLPIGPRSGFSFPSSHAVNNFAVATFLIVLFGSVPKIRYLFFVAALPAVSRIYLGLHYPSDVVGGALIGAVLGLVFAIGFFYLEDRSEKKSPKEFIGANGTT